MAGSLPLTAVPSLLFQTPLCTLKPQPHHIWPVPPPSLRIPKCFLGRKRFQRGARTKPVGTSTPRPQKAPEQITLAFCVLCASLILHRFGRLVGTVRRSQKVKFINPHLELECHAFLWLIHFSGYHANAGWQKISVKVSPYPSPQVPVSAVRKEFINHPRATLGIRHHWL